MIIRRFEISNFKIHKNTAVDLFPVTVFVGPNSGGKSAIFDALINFSMVCRGGLAEAFNQFPYSFEAFRHHAASSTARIRYYVELADSMESTDLLKYSIEFSQMPGTDVEPVYAIHNEDLQVGDRVIFSRSKDVCDLPELSDLRFEDRSILAAIRRAPWTQQFLEKNILLAECAIYISRIGRYRLDPTLMARAGKVTEVKPGKEKDDSPVPAPWLSYHGEDLASVLYFLHETESPILEQIIALVAEGIRGFEGFVFNRVGSDRVGFAAKFSDQRGSVVAPNLSDGTLSMIGLVTLAMAPGRPEIICIEEPENGLTPKALRVIYKSIRNLAFEGNTQVLMSSHSPFVIVDAWNGDDRDYIYQCHPAQGSAKVERFSEIVKKVGTLRSGGEIGLALAEQIMDGFREET